jgi:SecD/SecF fusion protein
MGSRRFNLIIVAFVAVLLVASLWVITSKETRLGLDLRGGTQLVYEGQGTPQNPEVTGEDVDRSIEIIRDRVDSLGVAEPEISRLGETSVQVNLPDVQDAQRAIDQVGDTAQLYFYDLEPNVIPLRDDVDQVTGANVAQQTTANLYEAVKLASEQDRECFQGSCTLEDRLYLFDRESKDLVAGPEFERENLFLDPEAEELPRERREILTVPQGTIVVEDQQAEAPEGATVEPPPRYFVVRDRPSLSGEDIRNPEQNFDPQSNAPNVTFDFSDEGRRAFQEVTREIANRGFANSLGGQVVPESFAIVLDDSIVSRPIIDPQENPDGIDGRTGAQISGGFEIREAQDLAEFLRIGALPVELKLISQSTVSATLGQQALDRGLTAGLIGLGLVLLFLIAYYRFLGVVAAIGLLTYSAFFFALIKLIPITLTLPGIAGLILTIGIAADSNIVIFERIKEEARRGHSILSAITTGYKRGLGTIIDANVITLLTAFILFGLATGGVKGFAFTLGIGVLVSLFTAVVFTRAVLGLMGRSRVLSDPRFVGAGEQRFRWKLDFAGASRWFFSASGAILALGAFSFAVTQLNWGIDFESGTRITAALEQEATVEQVRESLADAGVEDAASARIQEVQQEGFEGNAFQIQTKVEPELIGEIQDRLDNGFGLAEGTEGEADGFNSQSVGPTFGEQVARSAAYALVFSLLLIAAYVAFRFEAKYAVPVGIAVIHDLLITAGIYSLTDREVTSATVAALLTVLGLSLYDTVIVFDRIRENVPRLPRATFAQIANRSISEVLTRSLVTSLTTLFAVLVILLFGGETLSDFAFALFIGLFSGFYSSLFIATPVLIAWKDREPGYRARAARIRETMGYVPAFPEDNVVQRIEDGEEPGAIEDGDAAERGPIAAAPEPAPPLARGRGGAATLEGGDGGAEPAPDDAAPEQAAAAASPEEQSERERRREERKRRKQNRRRKHGRHR